MFKFNLGDTVRDSITGYSGVVISRSEWLHGCITYNVKSKDMKDGRPLDAVGYDEGQLDLVAAAEQPKVKAATTGGPERAAVRGESHATTQPR